MDTDYEFSLPSNNARKAFNAEIMPYIQDLSIFTVNDLNQAYGYLKETVLPRAQSKVDYQTYSRLIRYKSVDSSDDQYFDDINKVLDVWYERAKRRMERSNEQESTSIEPDTSLLVQKQDGLPVLSF
jgi:vacuolar-type H+-ATPase subunit I/STV1